MVSRHLGAVRKTCLTVLGLTLAIAATTGEAQARRHHGVRHGHPSHTRHGRHGSLVDSPRFSAMIVDAGSGRTLYAVSEDELRHPASLTKVMTLYLLFDKLDRGEMRLDTRIPVSRHAASMAPTKLGLRPGSAIAVEDAIKAIVTKSANDMAVAVAESVGGDETSFAQMMTHKAHALGMSRTTYVNASGLPDDRQVTTARDLTVLGRAIKDNFPQYYHYFSIPGFTYAGSYMANHNHLMSRFEGMDGIKTGYTRASGFNLLASVNQGGRRIVSVVMGGRTAASRDNIMASLLESHIEDAAPTRTAAAAIESPVEQPAATVHEAALHEDRQADEDRGPSLIAPTLAVPPVGRPVDRSRTVSQMDDRPSPIERPRPAFIAGIPRADASGSPSGLATDRRRLVLDGSTGGETRTSPAAVAVATATPSSLHWVTGPSGHGVPDRTSPRGPRPVQTARAKPSPARPPHEDGSARERAPVPRGTWVIQIGATDAADKASNLLSRARMQGRMSLAAARPFTEKVRKGDTTLYRARFAGLDTTEAEAACKTLKRSGFACFATKD